MSLATLIGRRNYLAEGKTHGSVELRIWLESMQDGMPSGRFIAPAT